MAEEQIRLIGTISGAASRIPGDFADREEMMEAVVEAQGLGKYDTIGVQKRTKNAGTGKFSAWADVESFPGKVSQTSDESSPSLPPDHPSKKIKYCVQVRQSGKWSNILVTDDKLEAAKRSQAEVHNRQNEELSLIQYDEASTLPDRGMKSLFRKVLKHQQKTDNSVADNVSEIGTNEAQRKVADSVDAVKARETDIDTDDVRPSPTRVIGFAGDDRVPSWKFAIASFFVISTALSVIALVSKDFSALLAFVAIIYAAVWYKNKLPAKFSPPYPHPYGRHLAKILFFSAILSFVGMAEHEDRPSPSPQPHAEQSSATSGSVFTLDGVWKNDCSDKYPDILTKDMFYSIMNADPLLCKSSSQAIYTHGTCFLRRWHRLEVRTSPMGSQVIIYRLDDKLNDTDTADIYNVITPEEITQYKLVVNDVWAARASDLEVAKASKSVDEHNKLFAKSHESFHKCSGGMIPDEFSHFEEIRRRQ